MSKDDWPKRNKFQTWFLDAFPKYLLVLILVGCVVIAISALLGPAIGNVYSDIYTGESWCTWQATAASWLDKNENGKWDTATESPLPGVQFSIGWDHPVSNVNGSAHGVLVSVSVCDPSYTVEISATPPAGYRLTTPEQVASPGGQGGHGPFFFGFAPSSAEPTTTPASHD